MSIAQLKLRYSQVKAEKRGYKKLGFDPTVKFVEYSLDLVEAKALLSDLNLSFSDRCSILAIIKIIERKLDYHYKHRDFDLALATAQFKRARKLLKI
jgi:hypothetical protein